MTRAHAPRRWRDVRRMGIGWAVGLVGLVALMVMVGGCNGAGGSPAANAQAASRKVPGSSGVSPAANAQAASRKVPGSSGVSPAANAQAASRKVPGSSGVSAASQPTATVATIQAVSRANPGLTGVALDDQRSLALLDAPSLDAVQWTEAPTIAAGELVAAGVLQGGVTLFRPENGDGPAFAVYVKGLEEPLVLLLPDLGLHQTWETFQTVAPMEFEQDGTSFALRAYSPLFMDVGGPPGLELRIFGVDGSGADALLAVQAIEGA